MKINKNIFIPHRWIGLKGLTRFFIFLFYIPFIIFLYSATQWIMALLTPAEKLATYSAPIKQLWAGAAVQSLLLAVLLCTVIAVLKTLADTAKYPLKK